MAAGPQTLDEIYRYIITTDLGGAAPTDVTLGVLLLALGTAISSNSGSSLVANVQTFGAKGDGTTNDTAAEEEAIASGRSPVFWPSTPARYKTTSTLVRPLGQCWIGGGTTASAIGWSGGATPMVTTTPVSFSADLAQIADLLFNGENVATVCLDLANVTSLQLNRLYLANAVTEALAASGCDSIYVTGGELAAGLSGPRVASLSLCTNWNFCGVAITANSTTANGIELGTGCQNISVSNGCDFEGSTTGGSGLVVSGTQDSVVRDSFFENWAGSCIAGNGNPVSNLLVEGNEFAAMSAAAACIILNSSSPPGRICIRDNWFNSLGDDGQCAVGILLGTNVTDVEIVGNRQPSTTPGTLIKIDAVAYPYSDLIIRPDTPTEWQTAAAPTNLASTYGIAPKVGDTCTNAAGSSGTLKYVCTVGGATPTWVAYA